MVGENISSKKSKFSRNQNLVSIFETNNDTDSKRNGTQPIGNIIHKT